MLSVNHQILKESLRPLLDIPSTYRFIQGEKVYAQIHHINITWDVTVECLYTLFAPHQHSWFIECFFICPTTIQCNCLQKLKVKMGAKYPYQYPDVVHFVDRLELQCSSIIIYWSNHHGTFLRIFSWIGRYSFLII